MKLALLFSLVLAANAVASSLPAWSHGPPYSPDYFPIAVWLQSPANAARFKAAGINLYVGLWEGPTEAQLATLKAAGMPVICEQNATGLANINNPIIVGWMHGDEPDNAQSLEHGNGYGPPIRPEVIRQNYEKMRAADPSRPVMLNLGQGVAWDDYIGRGVRRNHPEDYPLYLNGCDIASFDIYPVVHEDSRIAGKLEYVPRGVDRLIQWGNGAVQTWNRIECTHIGNPDRKATPDQVRAEVWMSLIHGTRGLIYFVHQFKPAFKEAALLDDREMLAAVTSINAQIRSLAPAINSPAIDHAVTVESVPGEVPISAVLKRHGSETYVFAAAMRNEPPMRLLD